ncbi:MAG: MoxR family ATPase [Gammaproteobacteria bacterium]|nr:MoxR family ATPase [Gammaproteobacteria bacterium]
MNMNWYDAEPLHLAETGDLPGITIPSRPEAYLPDPDLVAAVKVALMLGRPLLLTGDPGCGKTHLAYHLAADKNLPSPLRFDTKSISSARDLFYTYDAIGHFHAAQVTKDREGDPDPMPHITPNALGLAILLTRTAEELKKQKVDLSPLLGNIDLEKYRPPCRSVVLIDEIDKAPRDFPNDILTEVENLSFRIPELDNTLRISIKPDPKLRPVVVLTSNSEKHLPDAFLRRCVYYDIQFPGEAMLRRIIDAHLGELAKTRAVRFNEALRFFLELRQDRRGLKKKPATAELLNWLLVLNEILDPGKPMTQQADKVKNSFSGLVKNAEDQKIASDLWAETSRKN